MTTRNDLHRVIALACLAALEGCASRPSQTPDLGALWVRNSAEYQALAVQAFAAAAGDLDHKLEDRSWSALPGDAGGADQKPAIIFDIDETVVNNVEFQLALVPPFSEAKFDAWHEANRSIEVPGAAAFVRRARDAGVELFFITNRSCVAAAGDSCPQERIALDDLREVGISADADSVMLSEERPGWTQEKQVRREVIARDYRVIMVFGDDLGDFLPCVRKRIYSPCTEAATKESRREATHRHGLYWGDGWYVLPNPMYGSWTSVQNPD
jgi:5'-nucleotidase (lipoprotein e(P4) family)